MNRQAFTLIETVLAVAILATVLVSVIGLLPQALDSSRQANQRTAVSFILQDVQTRLTARQTMSAMRYDMRGSPCREHDPETAYHVTISPIITLPLPGETTGSIPTATLRVQATHGSWAESFTLSLAP